MQLTTYIALLRGINVGTANKLPMVRLRSLCADLGWADVQTCIQSGNIVFRARAVRRRLEERIEQAIAEQLGLRIPVIVRAAADWPSYIEGNPFIEACEREPNLVMLALSKAPPNPGSEDALQERARNGERVALVGDALWIHYVGGASNSKLFPGSLDRIVGSPVTTRNWRTVLKLQTLAQAH